MPLKEGSFSSIYISGDGFCSEEQALKQAISPRSRTTNFSELNCEGAYAFVALCLDTRGNSPVMSGGMTTTRSYFCSDGDAPGVRVQSHTVRHVICFPIAHSWPSVSFRAVADGRILLLHAGSVCCHSVSKLSSSHLLVKTQDRNIQTYKYTCRLTWI